MPPRAMLRTLTPLTARYDNFLYALVCLQQSGTPLSVLSAMARANKDPWEEAGRLSAMPKAVATQALAAMLDLIQGRTWQPSETVDIAARLIRLLPGEGARA